jgi:hypothetical protein
MWVTLAAAGFFALILLVTLVRAEKTVANGALTVITLLAIAIAGAAMVRRFGPLELAGEAALEAHSAPQAVASVPALSCLDGLAGEAVEAPCERALFASADVAAAAVSYTAAQISRLAPSDEAAAQSPEQQSLRRTLERDRYGLVAQVLAARDHCTELDCRAFRLFSDAGQIKANMHDRVYDATISRYAAGWTTAAVAPSPSVVGLAPPPTGKPSTIDFPNAASIPPVNIMAAEPGTTAAPAPQAKPPAAAAGAQAAPPHPAAAKKPAVANASAAVPKPRPAPPTVLAPAPPKPAPQADSDQ